MLDHTSIRSQLEHERTRIITDLETIAVQNQETGDWEAVPEAELSEADNNNEADGIEAWDERSATVSELETSFRNITRALQKITDGTYGVCEVCQENIEPARIAILPTARTCAAHKDDERTLVI